MRHFLLYLVLVLQAKLVVLEFSHHYAGEYDLETIRVREDIERIKCEHLPYRTVFTVAPGFKSFKFTCLVRKEDGCSRDEVYKFRLVESRKMDPLENYEALRRAILLSEENAEEKNQPICIFDYSVKTNVQKDEVHHHCDKDWYYTENAERVRLWTFEGNNNILGRYVPMCYKTFKTILTMSEARAACGKHGAVVAPIRNSMEEMAFMNSFRMAYPNGLTNGYGWVGMDNKCEKRNPSQRCFFWDYDSTRLGPFTVWKDLPNAYILKAINKKNTEQLEIYFTAHERSVLWYFGDYPIYGYTDWHCECKGDLCNQYPIKAVTCAKDATPPSTLPTARRVQYHCDDETWFLSRRSEFNGIPLCYKGTKVAGSPSYDESKKLCAQWGAAIAPIGTQGDMVLFYRAMDGVFPDGDVAGKYVYIALRNIKAAASDVNAFSSDWDFLPLLNWMGPINWFNESTPINPGSYEPNAQVHNGVPGWEDCVIVDLGKRKWRDWYCRCTDKNKCILEQYPRAGIACAKPANQFIY